MVDQRRFAESRVKFYASQICLALGHLHKNKIIYRDLKPENIFLDSDGYIAMGDFGLSKVLHKEAFTFCGTPEYISPEVISEKGYSFETDWWSFGVFIYETLFGIPPFFNSNSRIMYDLIQFKEVEFPDYAKMGIKISDEAIDIIRKLLAKQPKSRLGCNHDMEEVIAHPFFKEINMEELLCKKIKPEFVPVICMGKYDITNFNSDFPKSVSLIQEKDKKLIEKNKDKFEDFDI